MSTQTFDAVAKPGDLFRKSFVTPERAFLGCAVIYLVLAALATCVVKLPTLLYFTDYWEHRAIIQEVIRHGPALTDPIYAEGATSRQFTPWSLLLGYLARMTGIGADGALMAGALLVAVLFLAGVRDFARAYFADRWAPALFLAVLCCGWGFIALMWTGFYSLRSQLHSNYYPASLVFALTLIAWAQTIRLLRAPRIAPLRLILLAAIVAISTITHPLNALLLLGGGAGVILLEPDVSFGRRAMLLAAMVLAVSATTIWPYFNPLSLGAAGLVRGKATFNNFDFFYSPLFIVANIWPALFAPYFMPNQWRRPRYRVAVLAFVGLSAVYVAGALADISVTHRLLPYVVLAGHLIVTRGILDAIHPSPAGMTFTIVPEVLRRIGIGLGICASWQVLLAACQLIWPWSLSNYPYPLSDVFGETAKVAATLPADARPFGFDSAALVMPSHGFKVVAFPRPMPFSPSDEARQADYRRFFSTGVPDAERLAIARRQGATHVLYLTNEVTIEQHRELGRLGPAVNPVGRWRVITLRTPLSHR